MMIEEFEKLTGIYPTVELYEAIEAEYTKGDYESKEAFCKAYKENSNNFMAERIQHNANAAAWKAASEKSKTIADLNNEIDELGAQIRDLEEKLRQEQEWVSNGVNSNMDSSDYNKLIEAHGTKHLSDEEAADKIAAEFGFDKARIEIIYEAYYTIKNRHGQIRYDGAATRFPLYNATDWNFIKFAIGGYTYEMVNGSLHFVDDYPRRRCEV